MLFRSDTPRDVACARAFGAACVAVATGRHGVRDLAACAPDVVFPDLSETEQVLAAILDSVPSPLPPPLTLPFPPAGEREHR